MLELNSIIKDYPACGETVHALKGIDLQFRESEFVSILGPSGCGKTTMLNIIGGLDHYTKGDLIINGKSTKSLRDRDWDSYRNHSIGFVFQSYNLIPHQTVLQNVELALTLSGVSKSERRQRAKQALKEVGLETQYNKKPGEMSGGQMQRVAIARALVNNPDIILADNLWQEMLTGDNGKLVSPPLEKQYDVVYGSFPSQFNEIVLVLDKNNEIDDMSLFALGLNSKEEMQTVVTAALNGGEIPKSTNNRTYEEICGMEFRTILSSDCYVLDESTGTYSDLRDTEAGLRYLYDNALVLKVSGIIRPNEDASSAMLSGAVCYTSKLTEYIIEKSDKSEAVKAQLDNPKTDLFTGLPFRSGAAELIDSEKADAFGTYLESLDEKGRADANVKIMSIPSEEQINDALAQTMSAMTREEMNKALIAAFSQQMSVSGAEIEAYVTGMATAR